MKRWRLSAGLPCPHRTPFTTIMLLLLYFVSLRDPACITVAMSSSRTEPHWPASRWYTALLCLPSCYTQKHNKHNFTLGNWPHLCNNRQKILCVSHFVHFKRAELIAPFRHSVFPIALLRPPLWIPIFPPATSLPPVPKRSQSIFCPECDGAKFDTHTNQTRKTIVPLISIFSFLHRWEVPPFSQYRSFNRTRAQFFLHSLAPSAYIASSASLRTAVPPV